MAQLDTGYFVGGQIFFLNRRRGIDRIGDPCNLRDTFMVTYDSGSTWQKSATGIPACGLGPFYFVDSLNGWGVFNYPPPENFFGLMRTRDGGNTWTTLPIPSEFSYYCFGARISFLDSLNDWMYHCEPNDLTRKRFSRTRDGGITWDSLYTFTSNYSFYGLEALDSTHLWLGGSNVGFASVLFSSDGGRTWIEQMPGVGDPLWGIDVLDSSHAYAVGANGYVYIYAPPLAGDLNLDWVVNLTDIVLLINYVFFGQPVVVPIADIDFDADCAVDIVDAVLLINYVFLSDPQLRWGCAEP